MLSTLTIIGVGLIGGSIGLAARQRRLARRIIGVGRNEATLAKALALKAVDETDTDVAHGVREADLVVVCTPVESIPEYVLAAAEHARPGTLVTDAGSTKAAIVQQIEAGLRKRKSQVGFIGSHPMAGSEKNGAEHARADLFQHRSVIVTPTKKSSPEALAKVRAFWESLGGQVFEMSPADHDKAVATISHVPHVVAAALAAATPEECWPLVAGGWLDSTRIAAGDPELWRQILSQNRSHTLKGLARFEKVLTALREALDSENDAKLLKLLQAGKNNRDAVGSRPSSVRGKT